jgi:hypothetical protein
MYPAPMADGSVVFAASLLTVDLGLWWRPPPGGEPQPLTSGVGKYAETYLSADGRRAVATLLDVRRSLVQMPVRTRDAVDPRRMTDGDTGDIHPNFDPTGRHLTFSSARSGGRVLWLARRDATQSTPLTTGAAIDDRPAFSPDGVKSRSSPDAMAGSAFGLLARTAGRHGLLARRSPRLVGVVPGRQTHPLCDARRSRCEAGHDVG